MFCVVFIFCSLIIVYMGRLVKGVEGGSGEDLLVIFKVIECF